MGKRGQVFSQLFDIGVDILATTLDIATGVITAQLGDSTAGVLDSDKAEWWQHTGFASRPALPTQGGSSCQGLILKSGDRDIVFASRDTRGTTIYGNLADGEACAFAPGAQGATFWKKDGSVRDVTTDNNKPVSAGGKTIFCGVSPYYQTPTGPKLGGEWRLYAPWGGAWQDPTGYHLRTWFGAYVDIDVVTFPASIPMPTPTVTRYALGADTIVLDGAVIQIGRATGTSTPDSLVQSTAFQALMTSFVTATAAMVPSLITALTNTATSLATLGQPTPALGAAASALGVWNAAVSAAFGAIKTACATKTTTSG